MVGGWTPPNLKNVIVKNGIFFSPRKGEEKKHLKPPNRYCIRLYKGKTRQHG